MRLDARRLAAHNLHVNLLEQLEPIMQNTDELTENLKRLQRQAAKVGRFLNLFRVAYVDGVS